MLSYEHLGVRGSLYGDPERDQVRLSLRHRADEPPRRPLRSLLHGWLARPLPHGRQHHVCKEHVAVDTTVATAKYSMEIGAGIQQRQHRGLQLIWFSFSSEVRAPTQH